MIKKPTLVVLLCAVILGGVVFYLNKKNDATKLSDDAAKPAFSIDSSTITSVTLTRPARADQPPIQIVKQNGDWRIVQPIETSADSSSMLSIVDELSTARVSQSESGAPDRLKAYGLDPPQVSVDFQLQNGAKHSVLLGTGDFSGDSIYAIVDGSKTVSLVPKSLYTSLDKSFNDLRDHEVLHITAAYVSSFDLKNSAGDIAVTKDSKHEGAWIFTKPSDETADGDAINTLLGAIQDTKVTAIVSEKPDDLGKYGLATPSVTFTATNDKSDKFTLLVGKKEGAAYFARDLARPQIFTVDADLYKKLSQTYADLRDKQVLSFDEQDIVRIELQSGDGTVVLIRTHGGAVEWIFDAPADRKGKDATAWKLLSPLGALKADEVLDHPAPNIAAMLAKPAVQITLTDKQGKALNLQISKESGDFAYARTSANPAVYKLKKQALQDLNLKASDLAP
jgi:hypothetical protein